MAERAARHEREKEEEEEEEEEAVLPSSFWGERPIIWPVEPAFKDNLRRRASQRADRRVWLV